MACALDTRYTRAGGGSRHTNEWEMFTVCLQMFVSGSLGEEETAMGQKRATFISQTKPGRESRKKERSREVKEERKKG